MAFHRGFLPGIQAALERGCGGCPPWFGSAPPESENPQPVGDSPLPEKPIHNWGAVNGARAWASRAVRHARR